MRIIERAARTLVLALNGVRLNVSLSYQLTSTDASKFQNLRSGDYVRFYGVYLNNTQVELRQFY